jgi:cysteine desulfurase
MSGSSRSWSSAWVSTPTFGNPASSSHVFGQQARHTVELARQQVAQLINAQPEQIIWTSGATESNNLALKGVAQASGQSRGHIITSQIEHKAVLDTAPAFYRIRALR